MNLFVSLCVTKNMQTNAHSSDTLRESTASQQDGLIEAGSGVPVADVSGDIAQRIENLAGDRADQIALESQQDLGK